MIICDFWLSFMNNISIVMQLWTLKTTSLRVVRVGAGPFNFLVISISSRDLILNTTKKAFF